MIWSYNKRHKHKLYEKEMETNQLAENIKRWLEFDSRIHDLQKQLRTLKKAKKDAADDLTRVMKDREVESVNISNVGQILYTKNTVKKGINKKYLNEILVNYYKSNPATAKEVCDYILENRESTIKENIRLKK